MSESKAVSIRIPDELLAKVDRLAEEKYKSHKGTPNRSLVILDAIANYFDTLSDSSNSNEIISVSDSVSIAEFRELQGIVNTLSDTVKRLENFIYTLSDDVLKEKGENVVVKQPKQNQLSIIASSDSVNSVNYQKSTVLTGEELASILKTNPSKLSQERKNRTNEDFINWTRSLKGNLQKTGWTYKPKSKGKGFDYFPITEEAKTS